jgi:hypothetical protein
LRFVLDGVAAEVSFELPPIHFTIFLVGEPKAFHSIICWCLPSLTRLLVASNGDEGKSESMMVQERKKREKGYKREGGETDEGKRTRKRKGVRRLKKTFALISLNKN